MTNEFGYIDIKPFKQCSKSKQTLVTINQNEKQIEFQVYGQNKYLKLLKENPELEIYAVNSMLEPITAFYTF